MNNINCEYILTMFKKVTDDKYVYHGLALANKVENGYEILDAADVNLNGIIMDAENEVDDGFLFYEIKKLNEFVYFTSNKKTYDSRYSRLGYTPSEVIRSLNDNYQNKVLFRNKNGEFRFRNITKVDSLNIPEKWKKIVNDAIVEYSDRKELEASSGSGKKR